MTGPPISDGGWYFCDECGDVRPVPKGCAAICPWNGADAHMIPVHEAAAAELRRMSDQFVKDDGTVLRVGGWALLRDKDHANRDRWAVSRFRAGQWCWTRYSPTLLGALKRAVER